MKNSTRVFLLTITFAMGLANSSFAQTHEPQYEMIIAGDGFSSFNDKDYRFLTVFLNNNTDKTLYYRGADCYNLLFKLNHNSYFHLATDICKNAGYSKMVLPPHRSQRMEVYLTMDNQPDKDLLLSLSIKFNKWPGTKITARKELSSDKLSDTIVLHYDHNHQAFYPVQESTELEKKKERILPNKDIYLLTDSDRKLYTLTVNEDQITPPRDTAIRELKNKSHRAKSVSVPVSIHNNSNDTLRFYSMSCSWYEYWGTDNQAIGMAFWGCESNFPQIIKLAPHQEYKKRLNIIYNSTVKSGSTYRISMSLLKPLEIKNSPEFFLPNDYLRFNKIWSDKVTIR